MLSFGFYNSKGGDRKYDAEQIGAMFNGLITDGVFANYKEALRVTSGAGKREIVVRPGRAWFNGTWTEVDDGGHSIHLGTSFAVDDTFYICLAVSKKSRLNSIAYYKDIPENNPDTGLHYYLLAQINIPAGSDRIMDSMITDTRGSDLCPYVTGIMETVSFEELVKQVCGDSWQDWLGVYEAGITTGVQNAVRASSEALSEVKSLKAYSVESEAVSYTWAKFEAIATGGGGFEWATDSVHTELVDPPMPMCLFRDLSYADLGAGFKPSISLGSPYKPDGETPMKPVPASTQAKVWKEYPYFWEGGGAYGTEVLRYDDLQRVIVTSAGVATEKYRYRISRLVHLPVTYEPGAYMGTVTADNATAYPRDGYKDGCWYKRFAAKAEDVSFYYPGLSAKNVQDAIIEVARTGGTGGGSAMSVIEVEELPATGIPGVMYVVKKSGDSDAVEYLWLDRWEKVGGANSGQNPTNGNTVFAGKTTSFYGDSTTEENGHYGMGYHAWLKELLGLASYNNYGVSGYKIADVIAKVRAVSDTAQVIFCKIGVNDVGGDTPLGSLTDAESGTIYGGLNELCSLLRSKYPTRLVVFITPAEQTRYPSEVGVTMFDVRTAILEVCARHAIPVFDHYVISGICVDNLNVYTTDGCHLNNTAHEMLGKNLALYMRNAFGYLYGTVAVAGISLSASSGTLRVGESVTLTASVLPSNATNKRVVWESSARAIASVSGGVVTAIAPGTARITATTEEGGYAAYYDLTVEQASADTTYYTITNHLTNVTASNSTAQVAEGAAYATTLTAANGYTMGAVTVTMGGVDITADVYSGGAINIPAVTGDVVVTASAAVAGAVTYVKSITSDGNQYLDTGIVPATDMVAEVDFQAVQWAAWQSIFGCEKGLLLSYQERDSGVLFAQIFGGNVYSTDSGMSSVALTDRHTTVIDCANKTWTIDGQVAHSALYIGTENNGNNMLVFARYDKNGNLTGKSKTTLYGLKFSRGGETILDLRPCLDHSGVACMFDTVAQRYHYNLGTGEFTWEPLDE